MMRSLTSTKLTDTSCAGVVTFIVPIDGDYGFQTRSDDGSLVIIDGELVVNNDGWHGMQTQSGTISLTDGTHTITIPFYEDGGGAGMEVSWDQGGGVEQFNWDVLMMSVDANSWTHVCDFDFTDYGAETCDHAWDTYAIDCATLELDYLWDCIECECPVGLAEEGSGIWIAIIHQGVFC